MAAGRKIEDEREARACLKAAKGENLGRRRRRRRRRRGTFHHFCPGLGINGESDGSMSRRRRRVTFHHFCPGPRINGESGGAMSRHAHRQAHAPVASPPV